MDWSDGRINRSLPQGKPDSVVLSSKASRLLRRGRPRKKVLGVASLPGSFLVVLYVAQLGFNGSRGCSRDARAR